MCWIQSIKSHRKLNYLHTCAPELHCFLPTDLYILESLTIHPLISSPCVILCIYMYALANEEGKQPTGDNSWGAQLWFTCLSVNILPILKSSQPLKVIFQKQTLHNSHFVVSWYTVENTNRISWLLPDRYFHTKAFANHKIGDFSQNWPVLDKPLWHFHMASLFRSQLLNVVHCCYSTAADNAASTNTSGFHISL